jgi:hypothetical protein
LPVAIDFGKGFGLWAARTPPPGVQMLHGGHTHRTCARLVPPTAERVTVTRRLGADVIVAARTIRAHGGYARRSRPREAGGVASAMAEEVESGLWQLLYCYILTD